MSSQIENDGATVTGRPRSDGSALHGTECNEPLGTITSGESPSHRKQRLHQRAVERSGGGRAFARSGRALAARHPTRREASNAKRSHSFSGSASATG